MWPLLLLAWAGSALALITGKWSFTGGPYVPGATPLLEATCLLELSNGNSINFCNDGEQFDRPVLRSLGLLRYIKRNRPN
jgi:hypothetical protein